jgi:hypothetical protein
VDKQTWPRQSLATGDHVQEVLWYLSNRVKRVREGPKGAQPATRLRYGAQIHASPGTPYTGMQKVINRLRNLTGPRWRAVWSNLCQTAAFAFSLLGLIRSCRLAARVSGS